MKKLKLLVLIVTLSCIISACFGMSIENNNASITNSNAKFIKQNYSINLMWINKRLDKNQKYLFPEENLHNHIRTILKWSELNPKSKINIWYDSLMTTPEALENTKSLILENQCEQSSGLKNNIFFKDIRTLKTIQENPNLASDEILVWNRVDLFRLIAAREEILNKNVNSFVYADLDMPPISKKELFDETTLKKLHNYGFVLAETDELILSFENGFYIFSRTNLNMLKAINEIIIKPTIFQNQSELDENLIEPYNTHIFSQMEYAIEYFNFLQGNITTKDSNPIYIDYENNCKYIAAIKKSEREKIVIPKKIVVLPPSNGEFY